MSEVNRGFLPLADETSTRDNQPMVYGATLKERLWELVERYDDQAQVAELAGVSPQALSKWLDGGGATDESLRKLAAGSKENYFDLKYGREWRDHAAREIGPDFPVDPVSQADASEVFDALPPRFRELWVSLGRFLVQKYAPSGPGNPFRGLNLSGGASGKGSR